MIRIRRNKWAQATLEFTFGVIVLMFLVYGMVQVFRWAGLDLAQRRWSEDSSMFNIYLANGDPETELDSNIDEIMPMSPVYHGNITDGN